MTWAPEHTDDEHRIEALCAVADCRRERAGRWTVCGQHGEDCGQYLAAIPDLILEQLSAVPSMQAPEPGSVHGGGLKSHRSVGNLDVLVLRDRRSRDRSALDPDGNNTRGILEVLHAYATDVRECRRLFTGSTRRTVGVRWRQPGPFCDGWCLHPSCDAMTWRYTVPFRPSVASERKLLRDHLDWCLAQEFAADMWRELRQVVEQIERLRPPAGGTAYPRQVGDCRACGGRLWVAPATSGQPGRGWCNGNCGRTWTGLELARLSREVAA